MRYEFAFVDQRLGKALRYPRLHSNAPDPFRPTIQYIRLDRVTERSIERDVADYILDMPEILHIRFYGNKQYTYEVSKTEIRGSIPYVRFDRVPEGGWKPMHVSHYRKHKKVHQEWRDGDVVTFPEVDHGDPYAVESYDIRTGIATRPDGGRVWVHSRGDGVLDDLEQIAASDSLGSEQSVLRTFKNWPTWDMREAYLGMIERKRNS